MEASILFINGTREGCVYKKILRTAGQLVMKSSEYSAPKNNFV